MNPPWLDLLPIFEEGVTEDGIGVFTGSVLGVKNLCVKIADGFLHVLKVPDELTDNRYFWYYNEEYNAMMTTIAQQGVVYGDIIVEEAGFSSISSEAAIAVPALFKENVNFKILPV